MLSKQETAKFGRQRPAMQTLILKKHFPSNNERESEREAKYMLWYMRFSVTLLSYQDYLHFVFANTTTTTPPSSFPSISFSAGLESTDTGAIVRA